MSTALPVFTVRDAPRWSVVIAKGGLFDEHDRFITQLLPTLRAVEPSKSG